MIAAFWVIFSWAFWLIWMGVGLSYELYAVHEEKHNGALPLTRVVRDRLMRKSTLVKFVVVFFLFWLLLHFTLKFSW